jgi:hypothetical protein
MLSEEAGSKKALFRDIFFPERGRYVSLSNLTKKAWVGRQEWGVFAVIVALARPALRY